MKLKFHKLARRAMKNLIDTEMYFKEETTIDPIIKELVKIRASQINRCAHCLDMHTKDALEIGETQQRIFVINAWRETNIFTPKEKVVLELTERLTYAPSNHMDDELLEEIFKYFSEKEFIDLVLLIAQINTWNRINWAARTDLV